MQELSELADAIAATTKKTEKVRLVADYLASHDAETSALAAQFLSGRALPAWEERTLQVGGAQLWRMILDISELPEFELTAAIRKTGDLGSAAHVVWPNAPRTPGDPLTVQKVMTAFEELAETRGAVPKSEILRGLLSKATPMEAKYIVKIITGELRIGLRESLVEEAITRAYDAPLAAVKRANMLLGDIAATVRLAVRNELDTARMRLFHPIGFMLATPSESAEEAFEEFTEAIVEDKYDGIRAQVHVQPSRVGQDAKVRIYSRTLDEISESFPDLVPSLEGFCDEVILDGEILAWRNGRAMAFSELQKRLGRKRVSDRMLREVPVAYVGFDILALNGELVIDDSLTRRRQLLDDVFNRFQLPKGRRARTGQNALPFDEPKAEELNVVRAPSVQATSAAHLDELFDLAQERGNEGLMIKDSRSLYTPGRRGKSWLKLKRELATLDVVVTGVEFGNGKRAGVLSDYTFAIRSGDSLLNVGKAYTGLTDVEIAEMTEWFRQHTIEDFGHFRTVEPKIVIEVAFNAVMRSDRHNSGFALRFPRIVRLRPDKPVGEIDSLERVEHIYRHQVHLRQSA